MIQTIKYKISGLLKKDDLRSRKILKNIITSFGVKGGSIIIGLMLVPLTINYISPLQYGIWLTISSIVGWMSFFDVGMGNGLRNKLTAALAVEAYDEARKYVSTTYAVLAAISLGLLLLFVVVNPLVDWRAFLNIPASVKDNISFALLIVCCSFCIQFVVQLINTVLTAVHEPATAGLISFLGQAGVLLIVYILTRTVPGSLTLLVFVLTLVPIVVLILASLFFYNTKLRHIAPSRRFVDFSYARKVFSVGSSFLIIQIGALVLFQTDNIIITRFIGPAAVTEFNVVYKLFSVLIMGFTIVMVPYWSAFTDAYTKKDFEWMRTNVKKMRLLWLVMSLVVTPILLALSPLIYKLWIGDAVRIPNKLSAIMALYTIGYTGMSLNSYFLNGIGKIKIQKYLYVIVCLINIPLGIFLAKKIGTVGVVAANVMLILIIFSIMWRQIDKILAEDARGVWNQ